MADEKTSSDWIYLDIDPSNFQKQVSDEGFSISVTPSPYDIPEAMKSDYDRTRGRLRILFQYISEEPLRWVNEEAGVSFRVGRNSGRLYEIDLDLNQAKVPAGSVSQALADRITENINQFESRKRPGRANNYLMAKEAVKTQKERLFSDLPLTLMTIGTKITG